MRTFLLLLPTLLAVVSPQAQTPITAREHLDATRRAAQNVNPEARLLAVSTDSLIFESGKANSWTYLFSDTDTSSVVVLQRGSQTHTTTAVFQENTRRISFPLRGFTPTPIPKEWITDQSTYGSDRILERAEAVGGREFRNNHDNVTISARLASVPDELLGGRINLQSFWLITYSSRKDGRFRLFAVTLQGNAFSLSPEPEFLTLQKAQSNQANARRAVRDSLEIDELRLTAVSTVVPDINPYGESFLWRYTFYAPSRATFRDVYIFHGGVVAMKIPSRSSLSKQAVSNLVDSEEAASVATDTLFRAAPGVLAQATLTRGLFPLHLKRAAWRIDVARAQDGASGTVYVDAHTGDILAPPTVVKNTPPSNAISFSVSPPHPNPFRRRTLLRFSLPLTATVSISVYDASGRLVRHRALGRMSTGSHHVGVIGMNLASGLYAYCLTAQSRLRTRVRTGTLVHIR